MEAGEHRVLVGVVLAEGVADGEAVRAQLTAQVGSGAGGAVGSVADGHRRAVHDWLAQSAGAWRTALEPLTPGQRRLVVDTLAVYEREIAAGHRNRGGLSVPFVTVGP